MYLFSIMYMDHNDFIRPFINFDETVFPRFCPSCTQQTEDLVMTRHQILNWNKSDCDCHSLFWMKSCWSQIYSMLYPCWLIHYTIICTVFALTIFELAKSRIKVYSQSVYEIIKWRVEIQNPIFWSKDQAENVTFVCSKVSKRTWIRPWQPYTTVVINCIKLILLKCFKDTNNTTNVATPK